MVNPWVSPPAGDLLSQLGESVRPWQISDVAPDISGIVRSRRVVDLRRLSNNSIREFRIGDLRVTSQAGIRRWKIGDVADVNLLFNRTLDNLELIGGVLPPGLIFNSVSRRIQGTVGIFPKENLSYPVVFRATIGDDVFDRTFRFLMDPEDLKAQWTSNVFEDLGAVDRGSNVIIPLGLTNPDGDPLVFTPVGADPPFATPGQEVFRGLPAGLEIDSFGRIVGVPLITNNPPGQYFFRIFIRDPGDQQTNPRGQGEPTRTSEKIYRITLNPTIAQDARLSDTVRWITPAGSLGSTYETYPSHFSVQALPQFRAGATAQNTQRIRYSIAPGGGSLPQGVSLDRDTGLIVGRMPYTTGNRVFNFTVEARVVFVNRTTLVETVSNISSLRSFSITVRDLYVFNAVTNLSINVPPRIRKKIVEWVWGIRPEVRRRVGRNTGPDVLTLFGPENLFRRPDRFWGRRAADDLNIRVITGLDFSAVGNLTDHLVDYHHPTTLQVGKLGWARGLSPEGVHVYDVVYLGVVDPLREAGGFEGGRETFQARPSSGVAIPGRNILANQPNYFPNSVRNFREDLIRTQNRLPGSLPGPGFSGREGLPFWQKHEQVRGQPASRLGYQCVIELAFVLPGRAPAIVRALELAGMNDDLAGMTIDVDRYLVISNGTITTTFDGPSNEVTPTPLFTTFDGPESITTPTAVETTFDTILVEEGKYYKFPPGDLSRNR